MRTVDLLLAMVVGLAIVAVVLNKQATTSTSLSSLFSTLSSMVTTIIKPVGAAKTP